MQKNEYPKGFWEDDEVWELRRSEYARMVKKSIENEERSKFNEKEVRRLKLELEKIKVSEAEKELGRAEEKVKKMGEEEDARKKIEKLKKIIKEMEDDRRKEAEDRENEMEEVREEVDFMYKMLERTAGIRMKKDWKKGGTEDGERKIEEDLLEERAKKGKGEDSKKEGGEKR